METRERNPDKTVVGAMTTTTMTTTMTKTMMTYGGTTKRDSREEETRRTIHEARTDHQMSMRAFKVALDIEVTVAARYLRCRPSNVHRGGRRSTFRRPPCAGIGMPSFGYPIGSEQTAWRGSVPSSSGLVRAGRGLAAVGNVRRRRGLCATLLDKIPVRRHIYDTERYQRHHAWHRGGPTRRDVPLVLNFVF